MWSRKDVVLFVQPFVEKHFGVTRPAPTSVTICTFAEVDWDEEVLWMCSMQALQYADGTSHSWWTQGEKVLLYSTGTHELHQVCNAEQQIWPLSHLNCGDHMACRS